MEFEIEEELFELSDLDACLVYDYAWTPIDFIDINQLIITCTSDIYAMVIKEYQDAFVTIMKVVYFRNDYGECYIYNKTFTHDPEILYSLKEKQEQSNQKKQHLINVLKERGHRNINVKTIYDDIDWEHYRFDLITQINTIFPISVDCTFKEGKEKIKEEGDFLKEYKPEIWGCFSYQNDVVTKNFRILFDEGEGVFKAHEEFITGEIP